MLYSNSKLIIIIITGCSLRLIAPVIKDHGIEYERNKFQDKLNDGTLTLERTQVVWVLYVCFVFA